MLVSAIITIATCKQFLFFLHNSHFYRLLHMYMYTGKNIKIHSFDFFFHNSIFYLFIFSTHYPFMRVKKYL